MFNRLLGKLSKEIGIDLGTANTLVYVKDKGIVIQEPSVVSINTKTNEIIAVGAEAKQMIGKTPPYISTVRPLTKGIIADYEVAQKMIKYFIDKVHQDSFTILPRPRVIIGAPLEITEVERKAIEDAVLSAGANEVYIVEEPMAAAIGARMPIEDAVGNLIIDIGGGNSEIAVISLGGIVRWKSTNIAGDEMNRNIVQYARDVFNILLGETHAEIIKIQIGSAVSLKENLDIPMRGRDLLTGLPKEVLINDSQVREALAHSISAIVESIKSVLEVTPPELISDVHERGMLLTGGGALLKGMNTVIEEATGIPVRIADDPLTCVVRGTGILLEDINLLKTVEVPLTTAVARDRL